MSVASTSAMKQSVSGGAGAGHRRGMSRLLDDQRPEFGKYATCKGTDVWLNKVQTLAKKYNLSAG